MCFQIFFISLSAVVVIIGILAGFLLGGPVGAVLGGLLGGVLSIYFGIILSCSCNKKILFFDFGDM